MSNITVMNQKGEKVQNIKLNEKLFDGRVNRPVLYQALSMYMANRRRGCAQTKTRKEVRGGGKKPWRQKGTGRARAGSIRSPLWRGGGVSFGPHPKNWHYQLPKKIKQAALLSSLKAKINEKKVTVIDEIKLTSHKTKELAAILKKLKLNNKKLIIISQGPESNLKRASKNIKDVLLAREQDINAYQVLLNDHLLLEKGALEKIEKKFTKVA